MRTYKKKQKKSTVLCSDYEVLRKQAWKVLERWVSGKYIGMDNLDLSCPSEPENKAPYTDEQVEACNLLSQRWKTTDQLIAKQRWGSDKSKRSTIAIARRHNIGKTKVENRLTWIEDCVIENIVKPAIIRP